MAAMVCSTSCYSWWIALGGLHCEGIVKHLSGTRGACVRLIAEFRRNSQQLGAREQFGCPVMCGDADERSIYRYQPWLS
jgi:hypothetical protein